MDLSGPVYRKGEVLRMGNGPIKWKVIDRQKPGRI
jgi:hypothetical protein